MGWRFTVLVPMFLGLWVRMYLELFCRLELVALMGAWDGIVLGRVRHGAGVSDLYSVAAAPHHNRDAGGRGSHPVRQRRAAARALGGRRAHAHGRHRSTKLRSPCGNEVDAAAAAHSTPSAVNPTVIPCTWVSGRGS